jgi:glycosyltransferase involved in cell wall biosynthesis
VVHAHFWMSGIASLAAVRGTGVPLLQTFHALGSVKRRHQGRADTSPHVRVATEQRLCRQVDRVIATCRDEVEELGALGLPPYRADVIPCGVDTSLFTPGPQRPARSGPQRLVVVGRLVTRKGVGNVIDALARLRREGRDVELVVAGGPAGSGLDVDPEAERLRELAGRLGVAGDVRFLGGVARADVPDLMRSADVVVTVPWYEPFGIVPLEAMACGRPVVGSAVGGLLDTIVPGTTGELVPPRDPLALAEALRDLLDDPDRRARYGRAGRERAVALYDWENVVARTEEVYQRCLQTRTHRRADVGTEVAR